MNALCTNHALKRKSCIVLTGLHINRKLNWESANMKYGEKSTKKMRTAKISGRINVSM